MLVDAGPLVAAANRTDDQHVACSAVLRAATGPRLVCGPVIAEVCYLLARDAGARVEGAFLRSFATGFLTTVDVSANDLARAADLVDTYADLPLAGTDACVVALAERLEIDDIVTLDRRHFSVVGPAGRTFRLLP